MCANVCVNTNIREIVVAIFHFMQFMCSKKASSGLTACC